MTYLIKQVIENAAAIAVENPITTKVICLQKGLIKGPTLQANKGFMFHNIVISGHNKCMYHTDDGIITPAKQGAILSTHPYPASLASINKPIPGSTKYIEQHISRDAFTITQYLENLLFNDITSLKNNMPTNQAGVCLENTIKLCHPTQDSVNTQYTYMKYKNANLDKIFLQCVIEKEAAHTIIYKELFYSKYPEIQMCVRDYILKNQKIPSELIKKLGSEQITKTLTELIESSNKATAPYPLNTKLYNLFIQGHKHSIDGIALLNNVQ
jgi:hypothetical protein